jgi:hypothetical protein
VLHKGGHDQDYVWGAVKYEGFNIDFDQFFGLHGVQTERYTYQ